MMKKKKEEVEEVENDRSIKVKNRKDRTNQ
jgi:hypothetical protein